MGQRITRAKAKIKAARMPYRVPSAEDLPRVSPACSPCCTSSSTRATWRPGPTRTRPSRPDRRGDPAHPPDPCLLPDDGEVAGLLALMLLTEARRTARVSAGGDLVTLGEQDRGAWDCGADRRGSPAGAGAAGRRRGTGRYQILAAINAVHTSARDARDTDWSQVVALYDQLARLDPSPIVAPQPGCRGGRARRAGGGAGGGRPPRRGVRRLPRLPRDPSRPAAPARPKPNSPARPTTERSS